MANPLPLLIEEIENIHGSISDYAGDLGSYLFSPTSNPAPVLDETKLSADQLVELATNNKESAVDLTAGAISSTAYKVAGITRELSVRTQTKAMLYDMAVSQAAAMQEEVRGLSGKRVAELRSTTPGQTEGI